MASDAEDQDREEPSDGSAVSEGRPAGRGRRIAARTVLVLGVVLTVLCTALMAACFISDRTIGEHRGSAVAEVLDTSLTRTVVRFSSDAGRVYIPKNGVLYPQGLQEGQYVSVEYDNHNPDFVRVSGRNMTMSLLPMLSTIAGTWVVVLGTRWLLRRPSR